MTSTTEPTTATDRLAEYNEFSLAEDDRNPNTVWVATMVDAHEPGADVLVDRTHAGLEAHLLNGPRERGRTTCFRGKDLGPMPDDLELAFEALAEHDCAWVDIDPLTIGD